MATFSSPQDALSTFELTRILNQDGRAAVLYLLGTAIPSKSSNNNSGDVKRCPAILKVERMPYDINEVANIAKDGTWEKLEMVTSNDIYSTILAWYAPGGKRGADLQFTSICPATEKHIKKYSGQESRFVRETPTLYKTVVEPYISSLPASQISWVYNILDGISEAENVIHNDLDPENGFVVTPDLKWDQKTLSALYILVLTRTKSIRSLRDLRPHHLPLLKKIRRETEGAAIEKYGVGKGELRFYVHYQPTYYHFHVHVTHVSVYGLAGITVGQAHLLDDIIDNLELDAADEVGASYYERRTITYALGKEHGLYKGLEDSLPIVDLPSP